MPVCVRILFPACRCPVAFVEPCAGREIRWGARIGARMRPEASDDRLHLIAALGGEGVRIGTAGRALLHRRGGDHAMKTLNVENADEPLQVGCGNPRKRHRQRYAGDALSEKDRLAAGTCLKGDKTMDNFYFWFLFVLLLVMVLAWPTWPYTSTRWPYTRGGPYRYAPSGAAGAMILLILLLFWFGLIAIAWPWAAAPVVVE